MRVQRTTRGFTLVEMVTVIVLLGIIAGVLAPFIANAIQAWHDSKARAELVARGRLALERLAREVRLAVPNSLETLSAGQGIQFVRSRAGGRYIERFDNYGTAFSRNNRRFKKNATLANGLYKMGAGLGLAAGDILVIGNTSPTALKSFPGNGPAVALTGVTATTAATDGTNQGQILGFANHRFLIDSPGRHFAIADQTVEVGLTGNTLRWHTAVGLSNYDATADWGASDPILVDGVSAVSFTYAPGTPAATGVLRIDLQLATDSDNSIRLYHEVHVRNTP